MYTEFDRRMKAYEKLQDFTLSNDLPIVIRLDGKAFHSFTKYMQKPIDVGLEECFLRAAVETAAKLQYVTLGFYQSDEVSFVLRNDLAQLSDPWMKNRVQKFTSVISSMFTYYFNKYSTELTNKPAFFDCRVFNMPVFELINYLIWRQNDCRRNTYLGFAQKYIGKNKTENMNVQEISSVLESDHKITLSDELVNGYIVFKSKYLKEGVERTMWLPGCAPNFTLSRETMIDIINQTYNFETDENYMDEIIRELQPSSDIGDICLLYKLLTIRKLWDGNE